MGNCQAIDDNSSLVIQHPGGRVEKHYWPLSATQIMNTNPGHYVALLLTTTTTATNNTKNNIPPLRRITRIKLLKPTDTLVLGHVYRLVTAQEVMKGLWAKRHSQQQLSSSSSSGPVKKHEKSTTYSDSSNTRVVNYVGRSEQHVKHERRHRSSSSAAGAGGGGGRCKGAWQPSLLSISEAAAGVS
ncbi:PREDICTED: uncharacterized protein LOC109149302 isoform X2 [Ipomoea nil]|uniref:uncharacterized protein LOC109149302 isoform X2 n=1 Tax=Ipomoea nil TaxID=35883 RepID=UPI000900B398|nr:PREDICTED: uncharacterized protein LOC109149302 isoform X2 [Ipomoea nil]